MTRYEQGFMKKCAEYGVDSRDAVALMKAAAHWTSHLVPWKTTSERQDELAAASSMSNTARNLYANGYRDTAKDYLDRSAYYMMGYNPKSIARYDELQQNLADRKAGVVKPDPYANVHPNGPSTLTPLGATAKQKADAADQWGQSLYRKLGL